MIGFLASTARADIAVDGLGQMSNEAAAVASWRRASASAVCAAYASTWRSMVSSPVLSAL
ncbi:hypothetical protein ACWGH5_39310 [Streptomyces sp. NPDC054864]